MRRTLLLACLALAVAGCHAGRDRAIAAEAIRRYDRAVIEAHLSGRHAALDQAASEQEVERVHILVNGLRAKGQLLEASLEELQVREARFKGGAGEAIADERWTYQRVDAATRVPVEPPIRKQYQLRYKLLRQGSDWIVDGAEFTRNARESK